MTPSVVLVTGSAASWVGTSPPGSPPTPTSTASWGRHRPPPRDLLRRMGRAEFVRADIRNPLISKVIEHAEVDTVVHASLSANPGSSGGRATMKEMNVIGTMQLLAACQKAPTIKRMVLKSTTAVYGSSPRDPALFDETTTPKDLPSGGYAKDAVEIEGYLRGFGRRRPDVSVTVLRFSNFIGPRIDTVLTRYFALPVIPTVLGYDARVQLLHEEDALAVLERATNQDISGVYNVAADGVLLLSQAIRRAGRVALPVPTGAVGPVSRIFRGARLVDFSRSRCASSTSAGSSTPVGCAASSASRRAGPPPRPSTTTCAAARCARSSPTSRSRRWSAGCSPRPGCSGDARRREEGLRVRRPRHPAARRPHGCPHPLAPR